MIRTDLFATVLIAAGLSYGQAQAQAPSPPPNLTVEHEGRPTRYEERVDRPLYFLWHDENGWHVHSRTGGRRQIFDGEIKVAGGKIFELKGIGGLEKKATLVRSIGRKTF